MILAALLITKKPLKTAWGKATPKCQTAIMRTCHQLHAEAATVFYTQNIFLFGVTGAPKSSGAGEVYRPLIQEAFVRIEYVPLYSNEVGWIIEMLRRLPNVRQLSVRVYYLVLDKWDQMLDPVKDGGILVRTAAEKLSQACSNEGVTIPQNLRLRSLQEFVIIGAWCDVEYIPDARKARDQRLLEFADEVLEVAKSMQKDTPKH